MTQANSPQRVARGFAANMHAAMKSVIAERKNDEKHSQQAMPVLSADPTTEA